MALAQRSAPRPGRSAPRIRRMAGFPLRLGITCATVPRHMSEQPRRRATGQWVGRFAGSWPPRSSTGFPRDSTPSRAWVTASRRRRGRRVDGPLMDTGPSHGLDRGAPVALFPCWACSTRRTRRRRWARAAPPSWTRTSSSSWAAWPWARGMGGGDYRRSPCCHACRRRRARTAPVRNARGDRGPSLWFQHGDRGDVPIGINTHPARTAEAPLHHFGAALSIAVKNTAPTSAASSGTKIGSHQLRLRRGVAPAGQRRGLRQYMIVPPSPSSSSSPAASTWECCGLGPPRQDGPRRAGGRHRARNWRAGRAHLARRAHGGARVSSPPRCCGFSETCCGRCSRPGSRSRSAASSWAASTEPRWRCSARSR